MFYFYPSNRLHDLAEMLSAVINSRQTAPLVTTQILVQHTGMQHWLSLKLAELNNIAMNLEFPLPTRFVWTCCRQVLGDGMIPEQSPYKREIMVWRILKLLKSSDRNALPSELRNFILDADQNVVTDEILFSFARQLADVFEQYIVFRPQWVSAWDEHSSIIEPASDDIAKMAQWQSWIWSQLKAEAPYHPVNLQAKAQTLIRQESFNSGNKNLPSDVYVFAINTLPLQYFDFFTSLSKVTNIHFFMLNPCENYWGDAMTNTQIAKQLRKHAQFDVITSNELNPLLRNMGQQGKELLNQVLEQDYLEIASFRSHASTAQRNKLSILQDDIRHGTVFDNQQDLIQAHPNTLDGSIQIHGCYSQVRELQVLKDFLVDAFAKNKDLQLQDVLIMCPAIEDYAPYIQAVFESNGRETASLPVSISDRRPLESETAVESFMQIVSMNQTRFSLETVLAPLVDTSLAASFSLSDNDIQKVQLWLEKAAIVWGIDADDKSKQLEAVGLNPRHTWVNGLSRLIFGALNQQNIMWADDVACVEGTDGLNQVVLGRFIAYLDWLINVNAEFNTATGLTEWTDRLLRVLTRFNSTAYASKQIRQNKVDKSFGVRIVEQAIADLRQNLAAANCSLKTTCLTVVTALKQLLSIPETKAKFMAGKITFCSMMPMRSVPFKIIGVLGLNQDKYPRKSVMSELDLMSVTSRKTGDRSRANDDRYLFLEAILSAESTLYLSYLHRSVKDNAERMPSLVLKELIDYCQQRFGKEQLQIQAHGLHPFSAGEFVSDNSIKHFISADAAWFNKAIHLENHARRARTSALIGNTDNGNTLVKEGFHLKPLKSSIHLNEVVRFYQHPIRYFANKRLQVYFSAVENDVFEQTFDYSKKHRRYVRNLLVDQLSLDMNKMEEGANIRDDDNSNMARLHTYFMESGDLPDITFLQDLIDEETILMQLLVEQQKTVVGQISGEVEVQSISIQYSLAVDSNNVPLFFSKEAELSDYERLAIWLHLLCFASSGHGLHAKAYYARMYRGKPKLEEMEMSVQSQEDANALLDKFVQHFVDGCHKALPIQLSFAKELKKMESAEQAFNNENIHTSWRKRSQVKSRANPMGMQDDAYVQYLFDEIPELSVNLLQVYFDTYLSMFR